MATLTAPPAAVVSYRRSSPRPSSTETGALLPALRTRCASRRDSNAIGAPSSRRSGADSALRRVLCRATDVGTRTEVAGFPSFIPEDIFEIGDDAALAMARR
eukprot:scaffold156_cov308-Prasinococcus_capsulatus_cf.AAC.23